MSDSSYCHACGLKDGNFGQSSKATSEILKEANDQLEYITNYTFPTHVELQEEAHKRVQETSQSQKYILGNKIAYFSLKSINARSDTVDVIKRIERKKIKILEKTVQTSKKLSQLKSLQMEVDRREDYIRLQQRTRSCLDLLNTSMMFPLLDYSRLRLVLNSFLKFPIVHHQQQSHRRDAIASRPPRGGQNPHSTAASAREGRLGKLTLSLTGVSSILGIPLPDCGDYSLIPPPVVCSALAHIAHLLAHLGRTLNVPLPHPLIPFDATDFAIIKPHGNLIRHIPLTPAFKLTPDSRGPSPRSLPGHSLTPAQAGEVLRSPLFVPATAVQQGSDPHNLPWKEHSVLLHQVGGLDLLEGSTTRGVSRLGGVTDGNRGVEFDDIDDDFLNEHIFHSQLESSGLNWTPNPDFATGLILLQANVVHMCLTLGLAAHELWPPEALLLNLSLLNSFCMNKTVCRRDDVTNDKDENAPTASSDYNRLGKSLKSYCDVIQAKTNTSNGKAKEADSILKQLLAASRDRNRNKIESQFYVFDDNRHKTHVWPKEKVGAESKTGQQGGRASDHISDEVENDFENITFDYVESDGEVMVSDDDSTEYQYFPGGPDSEDAAAELDFAYEESYYGDLEGR